MALKFLRKIVAVAFMSFIYVTGLTKFVENIRIMRHVKQEFDKLTFKEVFAYGLSAVCMASAIVAIFISLYMPPQGEIHSSTLTYFGLTSAFVGSLIGISAHYSNELTKFKAEVRSAMESRDGKE